MRQRICAISVSAIVAAMFAPAHAWEGGLPAEIKAGFLMGACAAARHLRPHSGLHPQWRRRRPCYQYCWQ